jgi:hypothetical protein
MLFLESGTQYALLGEWNTICSSWRVEHTLKKIRILGNLLRVSEFVTIGNVLRVSDDGSSRSRKPKSRWYHEWWIPCFENRLTVSKKTENLKMLHIKNVFLNYRAAETSRAS